MGVVDFPMQHHKKTNYLIRPISVVMLLFLSRGHDLIDSSSNNYQISHINRASSSWGHSLIDSQLKQSNFITIQPGALEAIL